MSTKSSESTMNPGDQLFDDVAQPGGLAPRVTKAPTQARARVVMPNREQVELRPMELESLLPAGHRARLVWVWVKRQDLSGMYAKIKVREGGDGRSAIAPEILFSLWLYATLDGVGNGPEIARLVMSHDAYRWISRGLQVNVERLIASQSSPAVRATRGNASCGDRAHRSGAKLRTQNLLRL